MYKRQGDGGLKRILKNDIDLVILDLMLPDMDGFEVCRKIRRRTDIPILIVSAKKSDIDKIRGLGIGADDYITKPFSPNELVARVKAHLNRYIRLTLSLIHIFIENAAKEPHIVDVANFLNSMGADIRGAGTDVIRIKGVEKFHDTEYSVIPDQIEAGTFMMAAAATRGDVLIKNVIPCLLYTSRCV